MTVHYHPTATGRSIVVRVPALYVVVICLGLVPLLLVGTVVAPVEG